MRTWGEIKVAAALAGVRDDETVFMIDVGPEGPLTVDRDRYGYLEITSDPMTEKDECRSRSPIKKR